MQASNFEILINGARSGAEFNRAVEQAKCQAISEEYETDGTLCALEFADKSRLEIDVANRSASIDDQQTL